MLRAVGTGMLGIWIVVAACSSDGVNIGDDDGTAGSPNPAGGADGKGGDRALAGRTSGGLGGASFGGAPIVGGSDVGGSDVGGRASAGEGGGQPTAGTGGARPCGCPARLVEWGVDAPLDERVVTATLDCDGFRREVRERSDGESTYSCRQAKSECDPEWKPELDAVLALLESDGVEQALEEAPIFYGRPLLPDQGTFQIRVGTATIALSEPCDGEPSCTPAPEDVTELAGALRRLERRAAIRCSPECLPTAPSLGNCDELQYFWVDGSCRPMSGRSCGSGYETQEQCLDAHVQCWDLYTTPCGVAGAEDACADGEYCSTGQAGASCETGVGRCLPRPRTCHDEALAPVCACDGTTHETMCQAAVAGVAQYTRGACAE